MPLQELKYTKDWGAFLLEWTAWTDKLTSTSVDGAPPEGRSPAHSRMPVAGYTLCLCLCLFEQYFSNCPWNYSLNNSILCILRCNWSWKLCCFSRFFSPPTKQGISEGKLSEKKEKGEGIVNKTYWNHISLADNIGWERQAEITIKEIQNLHLSDNLEKVFRTFTWLTQCCQLKLPAYLWENAASYFTRPCLRRCAGAAYMMCDKPTLR